jgi:hypothetical protein
MYRLPWSELIDEPGSAISNKRESKSCFGQVFNSKLGHIAILAVSAWHDMQPLLDFKTRPRVHPVS